jgi:DNA primase
MIPDRVVEEVLARADLVEIIGEHITLKRAGKEFRALCPFHHEKTPSFYVVPAKGFYKCFGCGAGGNVFTFLMKKEGFSFVEAVRRIASKVGVEVPDDTARATEDPNRALYEAMAFAADFYQRQLWESATGARAQEYLTRRELTRAMVERFSLGYAPKAGGALRESANRQGITDAVLLAAGIIKENERAEEPYDRFRDRIIFPIADSGGRWIAFGGRVLGRAADGVPKYLNSPETAIYQKRRTLYGLNWSRTAIRREHSALVVEGYMDYVSLAARGVDHVVAGLGTAMTSEQADILARYTRQALLLYDSDNAGLKASFRAGDELLGAGVEPLIVTLPPGEDPDSVVRKGGAEALAPHLAAAVDVLDRKLQILLGRGFFEHIEGRRRALDRLLPTLRAAADPALKDIYVARVAERTGVRRDTLEAELTNDRPFRGVVRPQRRSEQSSQRRRNDAWDRASARAEAWASDRAEAWASERLLLLMMVRDPERIGHVGQAVSVEQIQDPVNRQIYEALLQHGPLPAGGTARVDLSVAAHEKLAELRSDPLEIAEGDRTFDEAVVGIRSSGLRLALDELEQRMSLASADEQEMLYGEKQKVMKELRGLDVEKSRLGWRDTRQGRKGMRRPSPGGNG